MLNDTSIASIRPSAATDVARPVAAAKHEAAPTELPPDRHVTPVAPPEPSNAARQDARQDPFSQATRQTFIDAQAREVVTRVIDPQTSRIVRQVPEEAMLRMRAYTRALDQASQQIQSARPQDGLRRSA